MEPEFVMVHNMEEVLFDSTLQKCMMKNVIMKIPDYCTPERQMSFDTLVGKTLTSVKVSKGDEEIVFVCDNGDQFMLWHEQDCCERVTVDDICGDWEEILNSPILKAEETTNTPDGFVDPYLPKGPECSYTDSYTWTFYRITTMLGRVVIRWYGTSNGYYSERVSFCKLVP